MFSVHLCCQTIFNKTLCQALNALRMSEHNVGITRFLDLTGIRRISVEPPRPPCGLWGRQVAGHLNPLFVYADLRLKQPLLSHLQ